MTGGEILIASLLAAQTGVQGYQGHVAARQARGQAREARAERKKVEQTEKAKAALLKQGIQESSTTLDTQDAFEDTGGVPMSIKRRLSIGGSGASV